MYYVYTHWLLNHLWIRHCITTRAWGTSYRMPVSVSPLVNLVCYTEQLYTACTITRSSLSYLLLPPRVPGCFHVGWAVGRGHWNTHIWNMEETWSLKISLFHVQSHKPSIFLLVSSGRSERGGKMPGYLDTFLRHIQEYKSDWFIQIKPVTSCMYFVWTNLQWWCMSNCNI